jgi:hypothetical protein
MNPKYNKSRDRAFPVRKGSISGSPEQAKNWSASSKGSSFAEGRFMPNKSLGNGRSTQPGFGRTNPPSKNLHGGNTKPTYGANS